MAKQETGHIVRPGDIGGETHEELDRLAGLKGLLINKALQMTDEQRDFMQGEVDRLTQKYFPAEAAKKP